MMKNQVRRDKSKSNKSKGVLIFVYILLGVCFIGSICVVISFRQIATNNETVDNSMITETTESIKDYSDYGFLNLGLHTQWVLVDEYDDIVASLDSRKTNILRFSFDTSNSWIYTSVYYNNREHTYDGPYATLSNSELKIQSGSSNQSYVGYTITILERQNVDGMLVLTIEFRGYSAGVERVERYYAIPSEYLNYNDYTVIDVGTKEHAIMYYINN